MSKHRAFFRENIGYIGRNRADFKKRSDEIVIHSSFKSIG